MEKIHETCGLCGKQHDITTMTEFDDRMLCADCLDKYTTLCDDCGTRVWMGDAISDRHTTICYTCFDNNYFRCYECGSIIYQDDACTYDGEDYCEACYDDIRETNCTIRSYGYKPTPLFCPPYQPENLYLGVELEIDEGGEDRNNARALLDLANEERENIYCKHDGSLSDGIELVTHPQTLEEHMTNMPWEALCEKALDMGYLSHDAGTCGLHVHVSRAAFGSREEQEEVIGRILYFVEAHWDKLLIFSRRTQSQLDRWAARYGMKDTPKEVLDNAKRSDIGRYACVNLLNRDTIEFRIFRGSLKYKTLIAALQLTDSLCKAAISMSDEEFRDMTWAEFVSGIEHKELIEYLKHRRIYGEAR